jgi:LemA protein
MEAIVGFIGALIKFIVFVAIVVAVIAFLGYNKLRLLSENIRESWSNIGVAGKKQASLVNQLIDVVKGYQDSEKLVMLKISDDLSSSDKVAQMHQQAGAIIATATGLAQRFPELKADQQYQRLIDSIQACEGHLEACRQKYNANVKAYNFKRSAIPHVFYSKILGFGAASYLEFVGNEQVMDMGAVNSFSSDIDGDRLNALLGQAGSKMREVGGKALAGGKQVAEVASDRIRQHLSNDDKKQTAEDEDKPV